MNDLSVAEAAFRALVPSDGRAQFAVDWLAARRAALVPQASKALRQLASTSIVPRAGIAAWTRGRHTPPRAPR